MHVAPFRDDLEYNNYKVPHRQPRGVRILELIPQVEYTAELNVESDIKCWLLLRTLSRALQRCDWVFARCIILDNNHCWDEPTEFLLKKVLRAVSYTLAAR